MRSAKDIHLEQLARRLNTPPPSTDRYMSVFDPVNFRPCGWHDSKYELSFPGKLPKSKAKRWLMVTLARIKRCALRR